METNLFNETPKERPILFSAPMVCAILEGRKTQTRRVTGLNDVNQKPDAWDFTRVTTLGYKTKESAKGKPGAYFQSDRLEPGSILICPVLSPYGRVGDRLWVRETFNGDPESGIPWAYRATEPELNGVPWKPSIFMSRRASRITLEITNIRVERLNEISDEDARAEGIENPEGIFPRVRYAALWNKINGVGSWDVNPWVWVVEFKRVAK